MSTDFSSSQHNLISKQVRIVASRNFPGIWQLLRVFNLMQPLHFSESPCHWGMETVIAYRRLRSGWIQVLKLLYPWRPSVRKWMWNLEEKNGHTKWNFFKSYSILADTTTNIKIEKTAWHLIFSLIFWQIYIIFPHIFYCLYFDHLFM